jgi:hypothetical protein
VSNILMLTEEDLSSFVSNIARLTDEDLSFSFLCLGAVWEESIADS